MTTGNSGLGYEEGVPFWLKTGFGLGKMADAVISFGFGTLLLLFYNQVCGLPGLWAGLAVMLCLLVDAVTDPAVGSLSDGFQSRFGRRHPFMLLSIVPSAVFFYLLFSPPESLGHTGLFLWLVGFGVLTRMATTFFNVPYMAMGAEFTSDYRERTTIVAFRTFFQVFGGALCAVFVWGYFEANSRDGLAGQLVQENYRVFGFVGGLMIAGSILISSFATMPAIPRLLGAQSKPKPFSMGKVFSDLRLAMQSKSFRSLFTAVFLIAIYVGVQASLGTHLLTFFWKLDEIAIRNWQLSAGVGGGIAVFTSSLINRWLDKRESVYLGAISFSIATTGPVMADLAGFMPVEESLRILVLYIAAGFAAAGGVLCAITGGSMMADIADEHEWRHGERQEGIYFGSMNFAGKATTAFGHLIAGITVDVIGLDPQSVPSSVPEEVLWNFGVSYALFVFFMICAAAALIPYNLSFQRHAQIMSTLQERRQPATAAE